jgi:pantoate kinase
MTDEAQAFVPGHVTGFFTSEPDPDPTRAGSRGGGLALTDGVTVTVETGDPGLVVDGDPMAVEAVERVLDSLGVRDRATVSAESDLPVGTGFGVSGALALGTALAANAAFDCRRTENELVAVAHAAEVEAGTGLGDVVAQHRGGIPLRLAPGAPAVNDLDAIPARPRVEYLVMDELDTATILADATDTLTAAGERALATVRADPTLSTFMEASRGFSREAGLLTDPVEAVLADVADAGGSGAMAMLGETVVALGTGLSDAGYDPAVCAVHPGGATVAPDE